MSATSKVWSGCFGVGLWLILGGSVHGQNASQRSDHPRSDTTRNDADNPPNDLSAPGGPGFINNPAVRGPYDVSLTSVSDKQFLEHAVMRGLAQIEFAKLALQKSSNEALKKHAQQLIDDRTKLNSRLGRLAGKLGMAVPGSLDTAHQARVDKLAKLLGEAFEAAYVVNQRKSRERDLQAFEQESIDGTDPSVKDFALKSLPAMKKHLDAIKDFNTKPSKK